MAVESDAQMSMDGIVIDDERLIRVATELDKMRTDEAKRKEKQDEYEEELLRSIQGKSETDATFHIGPITIKQAWFEREAKTETRVMNIAEKAEFQHKLKFAGVEAFKQARREAKKAAKAAAKVKEKAASTPRTRRNGNEARETATQTRRARQSRQAVAAEGALEGAEAQAERNERIMAEPVGAGVE
jgi:hypothetical protein